MDEEEINAMLHFLATVMPEDGVGSLSIKFNRTGGHFNILEIEGHLGRRVILSPAAWEDA